MDQAAPALATGATLVMLGVAVLPLAMQWSRGAAEARARANLSGALDAVAGMLKQARSSPMRQTPGFDDERRRQVDAAARLMAGLHRENPDDRSVGTLFVRGMLRVAEFRRLFGDHAGALVALDECEPVMRTLRASFQDDEGLVVDEVEFALNRAASLAEQGRAADAAYVWRTMLAQYDGRDPSTLGRDVAAALGSAHNNLSRIADGEGDRDATVRHLQACIALDAGDDDTNVASDRRLDRCRPRINLGIAFAKKDDKAAAAATYAEVEVMLQQLAKEHPDEPEVRRELARLRMAQAGLATGPAETAVARSLREEAATAMERLVAAWPERAAYRQEHGVMLNERAADAYLANDLAGAARLAGATVASHRELLTRAPDNAEYASQTATFLKRCSVISLMQGRRDDAFAELREAIALQERVVQQRSGEPGYAVEAAALYQELGIFHWRAEEWPAARDALRRAREHYEAALAKGYAAVREVKRLPKLLMVLAQAEAKCDDFDAIVNCLRRHQEVHPVAARELRQLGASLHVDDRADFQELLRAADAAAVGSEGAQRR